MLRFGEIPNIPPTILTSTVTLVGSPVTDILARSLRSEERRVGKECRP